MSDELRRQRAKSPTGARIAATLGSLHKGDSGITLVFADARTDLGILTLLRTPEFGAFTSREVCVLTLALNAVSGHLSASRMEPAESGTSIALDLQAALEETVRQLTAGRSPDTIRVQPMSGPSDLFIGVRID